MKKIHLIGNSHLDAVWLWQWQEGFAEIKATFRSALDRMKEFDDFKFTSACGIYYMWIEKSDKAMFEEIRQRVAEGRWCLVGGWLLQPDCNMPSGESFARHALITQRYFKEKFGVTAKVGYNVDSFGHNGNLPQILRKSGMDSYVFMRPGVLEKELPSSLFDWQSRDGSSVRTFRIFERYNIDVESFDVFDKIDKECDAEEAMAFYGVGNHGGGATIELLDKMHSELGENFVYSTPNEYFDSVKDKAVPTVSDDLQFHAKGCYSVCSGVKADNAKAENMLYEAEAYSALSEQLMDTEYPAEKLDTAWKNVLFNQFHDILCGCSIREAYTSASNMHGEAMSIAEKTTNFAVQQISWNIDTMAGKELIPYKRNAPLGAAYRNTEHIGTPVVVFNPNAFSVEMPVFVRDMPVRMTDNDGNEVAIQKVRDSKTNWDEKYKTAFTASLPPLGYKVYRMYFEGEATEYTPKVFAENGALENDLIRVEFDESTAEIARFIDKRSGKSIICPGSTSVLVDETECDTWAHGISRFKNVHAKCTSGRVSVIESGALRCGIRCEQEFENTKIVRDYYLSHNSDEVVVRTKIDFYEKHKMLKFAFKTAEKVEKSTCGIPFGFIERASDGDEQVFNAWCSLAGLGVATEAKHSFDADGDTLSLTVLRGAIYADHYGYRDELCEYQDQGEHFFTYSLFPFSSPSDAVHRADKLARPPFAIVETFHHGKLGCEFSGVTVSADNVIVTAVKKQADGQGFVIRLYEANDVDTTCEINVFGTSFTAHFSHNEIKTFVVSDGKATETDLIEF